MSLLAGISDTLARKCVNLARFSDTLARKCVNLASISDILAKIRAGAPGPAGPETGPVPAWTGTGRAGQAVGTSLFPSAQPIRLCARGGRGGQKN